MDGRAQAHCFIDCIDAISVALIVALSVLGTESPPPRPLVVIVITDSQYI
jgi:hypothetical protein